VDLCRIGPGRGFAGDFGGSRVSEPVSEFRLIVSSLLASGGVWFLFFGCVARNALIYKADVGRLTPK
jgi:hypothetical protein